MSLTLKSYQYDTIKKIIEHKRKKLIIAMDTGTGKTIIGLTLTKIFQDQYDKILIVVPPILIENAWLFDNNRFFGLNIRPLKSNNIDDIFKREYKIYIISYNILRMKIDIIKKQKWGMILFDESHKLGNRKTKTTKAVIGQYYFGEIRNALTADRIYLLTGTPRPNRDEQLYSQMRAVGYTVSWTKFENEYFDRPSELMPFFIKLKTNKRKDFLNLIKRYMIVVEKKDTELKDIKKIWNFIDFPMGEKCKNIQHYLKRHGLYRDKNYTIVVDYKINEFILFRELSSGFININGKVYEYDRKKLRMFEEFIKGRANDTTYIVWYSFNYEREQIESVLKGIDYRVVSGRETDKQKKDNIEWFKNTKKGVLLIQYNTGKLGLTFTNCNNMVYYSLINDNEAFIQSQNRIHRLGQEKPCYYYVFRAIGGIDTAIWEALKEKGNMSQILKNWVKNNG